MSGRLKVCWGLLGAALIFSLQVSLQAADLTVGPSGQYATISAAIDDLFLRCLGRRPVDQERLSLVAAWKDVLQLKEDESKQVKQDENPKVAAMIAVARIVMNLDEFITRD